MFKGKRGQAKKQKKPDIKKERAKTKKCRAASSDPGNYEWIDRIERLNLYYEE